MKRLKLKHYRVIRGGSWGNSASNLRAANRNGSSPSFQIYYVGARLVRGKR